MNCQEASDIVQKNLKDFKSEMRNSGEIKPDGRFKNTEARLKFETEKNKQSEWWSSVVDLNWDKKAFEIQFLKTRLEVSEDPYFIKYSSARLKEIVDNA